MNDPINPAHYAGRACADIGERLSANGYQVLKYVWRLGRKDAAHIELGKAVWCMNSECHLMSRAATVGIDMRTAPLIIDLVDADEFLYTRIHGQPLFTQSITKMLWRGYNLSDAHTILSMLQAERETYASS